MKLMNVRLDEKDVAKVEELRRRGIEFSSIVRDAVRTSYDEHVRRKGQRPDAAAFFAEMDAKYPLPTDLPPRGYSVHDAHQARAAIVAHLKRKRSKP